MADRLMFVPDHSEIAIKFACRFGISMATFARLYEVNELLDLLQELSQRRARLLVVTSFPLSVRRQLPSLRSIHPTMDLSGLSIRVLGAPQAYSWNKEGQLHADWVQSLNSLEESPEWDPAINQVALLGCGAFGMPLAAHAQSRGMASIYVGGRAPTLFGVVGKHDRALPQVRARMNAFWISPIAEETPRGKEAVEGGVYWAR